MNKKKKLIVLKGGDGAASIGVTTTGAQTLTIAALTVDTGKTITVDWGDGSTSDYTGAGSRTHNYAGAGTWTIRFVQPSFITVLHLTDAKMTVNSKPLRGMLNITEFKTTGVLSGAFNSSDISAWRPSSFSLYSMPAGYTGAFNSSDVSNWRPSTFYMRTMPSGYTGSFNSSDISAWRPSTFMYSAMPSGCTGTFNSANMSAWTPSAFTLASSTITGAFDSSDISAWRPSVFNMASLPIGYAGTLDTADMSAWRAGTMYIYSLPGIAFTFTASAMSGWVSTAYISIYNNSLLQGQVNQILSDMWAAFATKTAAAGDINIGGTNAAPSGVYQAANPPTTGLEYRYELLNDSQNINPTKKWATVTVSS